jgi:3-oxoacyl-[acyl-carrier-protein] synthase II
MMAANSEIPQNPPRVVITGLGVVSPVGVGKDAYWRNLMGGRSGIGFLKAFPSQQLPCRLAAEIEDFNPLNFLRQKKLLKVMSRDIQLGVGAAALAMQDAALNRGDFDPDRLGVVFGAGRMSSTPQELAEAAAYCARDDSFNFDLFGEDCMDQICPLWLLPQLPNMPACHVAIEHDARGPNNTITSREASALLALSEAVSVIQRGIADWMIVGACGSDVHPVDIARLTLFENLSRRDDPQRACRPFDIDRDGCILGEGAAAFLVENYQVAQRRGADVYAEVLGVAAGCDGSGRQNGAAGMGLAHSIASALRKAGLQPDEIGHINAHGKSTKRDDLVEARAYHRALGTAAETIPVTALKSYFGTFDAGAGAVELAGSVLALRHGVVPFTLNYETPDPLCRLNVIHQEPLPLRNLTALSVNRTAVGQSVAAVIRAV